MLHCLHLPWVEVWNLHLWWQVMSSEKNVDVIGVEHLSKLLVHLINLHLWAERESLHEEHWVLKSLNIWVVPSFPDYFHNLLESTWDETTVWNDFDWDWSGCVDEECDWTLLAWIGNSKLWDQVAFKVLKIKLLVSGVNVNELRTGVNCWDESKLIGLWSLLFTWLLTGVLTIVIFITFRWYGGNQHSEGFGLICMPCNEAVFIVFIGR